MPKRPVTKSQAALVAENEKLRTENRQLRAYADALQKCVDSAQYAMRLINDELESVANRNAPVIVKLQKLIDDDKRNRANLASGRTKGAAKNKSRAEKLRDDWKRIAADLRKYSQFKDYNLDQRAEYIQKHDCGKMKNGKPYSARTIRDVIKGVK